MSGLRVAIDATPAIAGRTGIARYVIELTAALRASGVDARLFAVGRALVPLPDGCRHVALPARAVHRSWALGGPPRPERLVGPVDVVHATGLLPPASRRPVVATVHDLAALDHPELHSPRLVGQLTSLLRHLGRAAVVLAVSNATADSLEQHGVARDRILVTPLGVTGLGVPSPGAIVPAPYLLAVGEQMPRKGLAVLLEALARSGLDLQLVHAGPPSSATAELRAVVDRLGLGARVRFLGHVSSGDLAALYRDATALCFPSLAEGFGLPVLEALAAGLPVVASDIPSVREVVGDAALLPPPGDAEAWAAALVEIVTDESRRATLTSAGRVRAARFTWGACAAATVAAYERAIGHR